jgi:DNA-binding transcriptional regulator YiaG
VKPDFLNAIPDENMGIKVINKSHQHHFKNKLNKTAKDEDEYVIESIEEIEISADDFAKEFNTNKR